jgi:hypothetical protein
MGAFGNRLRKEDTVATDEFIVRFSGRAVLGVDIGNRDIAWCSVRLPLPSIEPNTLLAEAISPGRFQ